MPLAGVHALAAHATAITLGHLGHAQIAEASTTVGLVQLLADQRSAVALRAAGTAAVQGADALAKQDAGQVGHVPMFAAAQDVPLSAEGTQSDRRSLAAQGQADSHRTENLSRG